MMDPVTIEARAARIGAVNFDARVITVLAVPYEEPARVEYRGQLWREVFTRGAFDGLTAARRIPVTAVLQPTDDGTHAGGHLVGKVTDVYPDRGDGLVLDLKISNTNAGTETLELAHDDALSPSVGFAIGPADEQLDRRTMTRRIIRAALDHLSLVAQPAYAGARVLSVRAAGAPALAEDPIFRWAAGRLNKSNQVRGTDSDH